MPTGWQTVRMAERRTGNSFRSTGTQDMAETLGVLARGRTRFAGRGSFTSLPVVRYPAACRGSST